MVRVRCCNAPVRCAKGYVSRTTLYCSVYSTVLTNVTRALCQLLSRNYIAVRQKQVSLRSICCIPAAQGLFDKNM